MLQKSWHLIEFIVKHIFRDRKTHYPKTYFLLKRGSDFYLLFWLEYGKDNSLYIWFDDNPNNGWEVVARHRQSDVIGSQEVEFYQSELGFFDPHLSWHQSGRIHAGGYSKEGQKGERVISDRTATSFSQLESGITVPFSQIIFPTVNAEKALKSLGKGVRDFFYPTTWMGMLNKSGFRVVNNGAPGEAFFIIDNEVIPKDRDLAIDISIHHKNHKVDFSNMGQKQLNELMVYPEAISFHKGKTDIAACLRIFSVDVLSAAKEATGVAVTCFNNETVDIFQMKKLV